MRITFGLAPDTSLSGPGDLLGDPRLVRGTELWSLGLYNEARLEFEDLRSSLELDAARTFRLSNYLLDLGLYRPAIFAARQVLTLAGMGTQLQTLAAPRYFNHVRYGAYYNDLVAEAAAERSLHPLFLFSLIRQESLFEGFVRSGAGARGLMQIVPSTGESLAEAYGWPPDFTPEDLYRPAVSVRLGALYLTTNLNGFGGEIYPALAAYNAGPGSAQVWRDLSGGDPDLFLEVVRFEETRGYIRSIFEIYWMYRALYETTP
jgi:soluble lytic murein transglycosylase